MSMQIDTELVAGRELDGRVATEVMGWEPYSGGYYYGKDGHILVCLSGEPDGSRPPWSPSTDIAAAFQVWERVVELLRQEPNTSGIQIEQVQSWWQKDEPAAMWRVNIVEGNNGDPETMFVRFSIEAPTAPLAICKAALQAVNQC
jgi:hypothetical protein